MKIYTQVNQETNKITNWCNQKLEGVDLELEVSDDDIDSLNQFISYCFVNNGKFFFDKKTRLNDVLENDKNDLLQEIRYFFEIPTRILLLKNGRPQFVVVNQNFIDDLESAINQAQENGGIYKHRYTDYLTKKRVLDENGMTITIFIDIKALAEIKKIFEIRRGFCACARDWHIATIDLIKSKEELEAYISKYSNIINGKRIWCAENGEPFVNSDILKIDDKGKFIGIEGQLDITQFVENHL